MEKGRYKPTEPPHAILKGSEIHYSAARYRFYHLQFGDPSHPARTTTHVNLIRTISFGVCALLHAHRPQGGVPEQRD